MLFYFMFWKKPSGFPTIKDKDDAPAASKSLKSRFFVVLSNLRSSIVNVFKSKQKDEKKLLDYICI